MSGFESRIAPARLVPLHTPPWLSTGRQRAPRRVLPPSLLAARLPYHRLARQVTAVGGGGSRTPGPKVSLLARWRS